MRSIKQTEFKGKRVLVRGDLDVPLAGTDTRRVSPHPSGVGEQRAEVADDTRLRALLPTLKHLIDSQAKVIIIGHLGRPDGAWVPSLSLCPVAERLSELSGFKIEFVEDIVGEKAKSGSSRLEAGGVLMLENLRFEAGEEANDDGFAREIAGLADIYVNDSFASSHRVHASVVGIPKHLESFAGFALENEVANLSKVLENPKRPLVFILGGAKTETKKPLVKDFSKFADSILLGGLLGYSKELEGIPKVIFPIDAVDAFDIGPKTVELFSDLISRARTVVWNGPLGKFEEDKYEDGTLFVAKAVISSPVFSVVGGGDTISALNKFELLDKIGFVSLGGGAMLEFLAGRELPGLAALGFDTGGQM